MAEMTGGELLLRCLHAEGVRHINAITDGTYMMVIEALERLGDELGIRLVVPRHEAAGAPCGRCLHPGQRNAGGGHGLRRPRGRPIWWPG